MLPGLIHPELHRLPGCAVATVSTAAAGWGKLVVPRGPDCDGLGGLISIVRASAGGGSWRLWYADDGRRVHVRAFGFDWSSGAARPVYTRLRVWSKATRVRVTPYATGRPDWIPLPPFNTTHWLQLPSGCTYGAEELAE